MRKNQWCGLCSFLKVTCFWLLYAFALEITTNKGASFLHRSTTIVVVVQESIQISTLGHPAKLLSYTYTPKPIHLNFIFGHPLLCYHFTCYILHKTWVSLLYTYLHPRLLQTAPNPLWSNSRPHGHYGLLSNPVISSDQKWAKGPTAAKI